MSSKLGELLLLLEKEIHSMIPWFVYTTASFESERLLLALLKTHSFEGMQRETV